MKPNYLIEVGLAFDMMLNALLGGWAGQTLSYRAAVEAIEHRKPFWCVFCRILSSLVRRSHCEDQLAGISMDGEEYARAFIGMAVLAGLLATPIMLLLLIL